MTNKTFATIFLACIFSRSILLAQDDRKTPHENFSHSNQKVNKVHEFFKQPPWIKRNIERKNKFAEKNKQAKNEKENKKTIRNCGQSERHIAFRDADPLNPQYFAKRTFIKITPSSVFDYHGPMLPIGIEYRFNEEGLSIAIEGGIPLFYKVGSSGQKTITFDEKFRLEGRKYFNIVCNRRLFIGMEAFIRKQDFTIKNADYVYLDADHYSFSFAQAHKLTYGGGIFIGVSEKLVKHLYLDTYGGIGLRYLSLRYYNVQNAQYIGDDAIGSGIFFINEDKINGAIWKPYVILGMKVGYLIPSRNKKRR